MIIRFSSMRFTLRHAVAALALLLSFDSFCSGQPDNVNALFDQGALQYDTAVLKSAFNQAVTVNGKPDYLFQARCLWRIQVVKFLLADSRGTVLYGKRTLSLLDSAEKRGVDQFSVAAVRALASQVLAGTGAANGAFYGPRTGKYLQVLKKLKPVGFETRLVEAFNYLEAPSFAGGSLQKASDAFTNLHKDYPDSTIVTINLARCFAKQKRIQTADSLCTLVLKKNPRNLWAKTVRAGLNKGK